MLSFPGGCRISIAFWEQAQARHDRKAQVHDECQRATCCFVPHAVCHVPGGVGPPWLIDEATGEEKVVF